MSSLYPLKFTPRYMERIWGGNKLKNTLNKEDSPPKTGESWEISGVEQNISVVSEGFLAGNNLQELIEVYMGDLVGEKVYDKFGLEFPLLIKFIDTNDMLSIQVHPDDNTARQRHKAFGKTEMWYVLEAGGNSQLISGFKPGVDKQSYLQYLQNNKLEEIMNFINVEKGDVFYVPAGRVHAIGPGIILTEIQQASDITYRIYDWERKDNNGKTRELHTELAANVIDFSHPEEAKNKYEKSLNESVNVVDCDYFRTNIMSFDQSVDKELHLIDSFVIYICTEGSVALKWKEGEIQMQKGDCTLVPNEIASIRLNPESLSTLLEVYIP